MLKPVKIKDLLFGNKFRLSNCTDDILYEKRDVCQISMTDNSSIHVQYCAALSDKVKNVIIIDERRVVYVEIKEVSLCEIKSKGKFVLDNVQYIRSTEYGIHDFCCIDNDFNVRFFNAYTKVFPVE